MTILPNKEIENHPALIAIRQLTDLMPGKNGEVTIPASLADSLAQSSLNGFLYDGCTGVFKRLKFALDLQVGVHVHIDMPSHLAPAEVAFLRDNLEHLFAVAMANHDETERRRKIAEGDAASRGSPR